jgi:hypothetical protein
MPTPAATRTPKLHDPLSAEDLARLTYAAERDLAPRYGIVPWLRPFDALDEPVKQWRIAVAQCLLERVDARMRSILSGLYEGLMLKREEGSEHAETDSVHP